jgi:hypothetical protein
MFPINWVVQVLYLLEYIILYYSLFIVFSIRVYFLPYVVLDFLLNITHCLFINRDLCNIVIMNMTQYIYCSLLFSSALSFPYISPIYLINMYQTYLTEPISKLTYVSSHMIKELIMSLLKIGL